MKDNRSQRVKLKLVSHRHIPSVSDGALSSMTTPAVLYDPCTFSA